MRPSTKVFKPHPQSEARKRSAVTLIKCLLAQKKPEVSSAHCRALLNVLLFKITEADGKYKTRFRAQTALHCSDKTNLPHDHVFQRAKMIAALEKAVPRNADAILKRAFACTVTKKGHTRISKFDKRYDGWARYARPELRSSIRRLANESFSKKAACLTKA